MTELLFSVGVAFINDLDLGNLLDGLRQEFEAHGITFSQNAKVSIEEVGNRWKLADADNNQTYLVRREGDRLNIYMTDKPRNLPSWAKAISIGILSGLLANVIFALLQWLLDWLEPFEILTIGGLIGLLAVALLRLVIPREFNYKGLTMVLTFVVTVIVFAVGWIIGGFTGLDVVMIWDFEDGTAQGWGVYNEVEGGVTPSADVTVSPENAKGKYALKVCNIDLPAPPKYNARKKWPAVRYNEDLSNARVTALVYVPNGTKFDFADAKLFLFDKSWEWRESGSRGEGVRLDRGDWVKLSWDLRRHKTLWWSRPWRNTLGIQVYVEEGTFDGPIYVDDVTIYK